MNALLELHKQFHWPTPSSSNLTTPTSINPEDSSQDHVFQTNDDVTGVQGESEDSKLAPPVESIDSKANLRRPNRPPDLTIPSDGVQTKVVEAEMMVETLVPSALMASTTIEEEVVVHSSTPSKLSTAESFSFASESMIKNVSSKHGII